MAFGLTNNLVGRLDRGKERKKEGDDGDDGDAVVGLNHAIALIAAAAPFRRSA